MLKIWVGKRESDILTYKYFDISITFWGSNINTNHSFCTFERLKSSYRDDFSRYTLRLLIHYITQNKEVEIHFYNNLFAYKLINLEPTLKNYVVNKNSQTIFDIMRHKTLSRMWLQNTVEVPPFVYLSKKELDYKKLVKKFYYKKFILQKSISSGGNGTYLLCADNWQNIVDNLGDDIFLVSPYYEENISLSCHLIIDAKNVVVFPILEQVLQYENNKMIYCGNKPLVNETLSTDTKKLAFIIGHRLMETEYRGICGLDFIFSNNKIMLIELNPRYLGSSYLINAELRRINLPSLFEMNTMAFNGYIKKSIFEKIDNMKVIYESYVYKKGASNNAITNHSSNTILYMDGFQNSCKCEDDVYLYRCLRKI